MTIPINIKGYILDSDEREPYIIVQDDLANTGGYLILQSNHLDFTTGTGHDCWVLKDDLEDFFHETGWEVEWLESG